MISYIFLKMGPNGIDLLRLSHLYAPAFSQDTSAKFTFYVIVICAPQKLKRKHVSRYV